MLQLTVLVTLVGFAASVLDEELHAKYLTMPRSDFVEYFNKQDFSWKMTQYNDLMDKKYLACARIDAEAVDNLPYRIHDLKALGDIPKNFDARTKWPECESIGEILNQGDCGSCWTFGTATTASDRSCIHKNLHINLAEQDFECMQKEVCDGGSPEEAFDYWKSTGLVTQECKPYDIPELKANKCIKECVNSNKNYSQDKHFADKIYRVSNESDQIKAELALAGPIQASFEVFADFMNYKSGIYEHKFGERVGSHSVRIIGYGVENDVDYWLVANSWGQSEWGDQGWFKMKSFQKDSLFEQFLITGLPKN